MSTYIEATPRTRQLFFLAVILLGGLFLALDRIAFLLPPVSEDPVIAIEQTIYRSASSALAVSILYAALSVVAIRYAKLTAESGQWPPQGMTVPFRTKVLVIKKKQHVWLYLGFILCAFALQGTLPWVKYSIQKERLEELRKGIAVVPSEAFNVDEINRHIPAPPL
jgi:hypothetical protein